MLELTGARRLRHRLERGGRALILLYHRIGGATTDPWRLAVSPVRFAEHLEVIAQRYRPLGLAELVAHLERGRVPSRAVAVTFDDGYADNLLDGLPALERHGIPAVVYVTAGYLGARDEFWWTQVERLLLEPGTLPVRLVVQRPSLTWCWELGEAADYTVEEARVHRDWVIDRERFPTSRHAAFVSLLDALQPLDVADRESVLDELFAIARLPRRARDSHRMLTADEACRLGAGPLVSVGAHTMTHPRLSTLPHGQQEREIRTSRSCLEAVVGRPVTSFAYPFGTHADFDDTTARIVAQAGFSSAGAVSDVAVSRSSPRFGLPRVGVADWTGEELERRMERWLRRWL